MKAAYFLLKQRDTTTYNPFLHDIFHIPTIVLTKRVRRVILPSSMLIIVMHVGRVCVAMQFVKIIKHIFY